MLILVVFFPLFNFFFIRIISILLGKRKAILWIGHSFILIVSMSAFFMYNLCSVHDFYYFCIGTWINCGLFVTNWGFIFDSLSVSMLFMVSIISGSVHYYSIGYMKEDPAIIRFLSYLSLFTFFMFILVTADNFIQLFLGWEGIGLCSYLLISFWNTRIQANKAAIKALIMNRVGDFGFLCGLIFLFFIVRSVDFATVFVLVPFYQDITISLYVFTFSYLDLVCLFLFIGSMGKSAQVGLHTWLPDAMEGPTPVSALIHAATLVTAGIFLIIRCSPLFEFAPATLTFILFIGGVTAFFAATTAIVQDDIKKVIAYSTASQLGYMTFICGLSAYHVSMFHLINHAFFKALLFLGAGSVIHAMSGEQDMRKFGGLTKLIPYTYSMLLLGFLALSGFPFLSGFYSKDLILEIAFSNYQIASFFCYWLGTLSAGLTAFYSFRVLYCSFWTEINTFKYYAQNIHELPFNMGFALGVLSIGSLFSGYFLKDIFVGFGTIFWGNSIYFSSYQYVNVDCEFIPLYIKNIPLCFSCLGISLGITLNNFIFLIVDNEMRSNICLDSCVKYPQKWVKAIWFFNQKWYFDYIYNYYIGYSILKYSFNKFYSLIDKGFIEILGPHGLSIVVYKISSYSLRKQSGYIYHLGYLLIINLIILLYCSLIF